MKRATKSLLIAILALVIAGWSPSHEQASSSGFRVSLSVSPFIELVFRDGISYVDGKVTAKTPEELQRLFVNHGANEVYARVATTQRYRTGIGDHSMDRALARARLAKALNLPFNPELGLFNIYGDIRCQPAPDFSDYPQIKQPAAWTSLSLDNMLPILRSYGAIAARQILDTGTTVRMWDLGNEVEFGAAGIAVRPMPGACDDTAGGANWYRAPDAIDPEIGKKSVIDLLRTPEPERIAWLEAHIWPHLAKLFAAVAAGIRSVDPNAHFSTHVSGVAAVLPNFGIAFYKAMRKGGFFPDELGFSYYPTSSRNPPDRLKAFKDTATAVHRELGRPIFIAEFGYPAAKMERGFLWNDAVDNYPLSKEGQASIIRDLVAWGHGTGILSGIRPWAPDLAVSGWGPMAFFELDEKTATSRPSLNAISEGLPRSGR